MKKNMNRVTVKTLAFAMALGAGLISCTESG